MSMPQENDTSIVSFIVAVTKDSNSSVDRNVHVVVVKAKQATDAELIITPLLIILPLATLIVVILTKINSSSRTNRVLNLLETIFKRIDRNIEKGRL